VIQPFNVFIFVSPSPIISNSTVASISINVPRRYESATTPQPLTLLKLSEKATNPYFGSKLDTKLSAQPEESLKSA
jgi:hypothetical protein